MLRISDILTRPGSDWNAFAPPVPGDTKAAALHRIGRSLPKSLIELYEVCNGGEGSLPFQPWNFVLWDIGFVAETREEMHYREWYDQFVFFGSNGGGEYFGLDPSGRVFFMDPVAGEQSIIVVSQSFDEFVKQIGFLPEDGIPEVHHQSNPP